MILANNTGIAKFSIKLLKKGQTEDEVLTTKAEQCGLLLITSNFSKLPDNINNV